MKTFLFVFLFVSSFTYAAAPPSINNPAPFIICDEYNDGFGVFDIFTRNSEILGSLNPANFTVSYHSTLADAQNNSNIISVSETTYYTNIVAFAETIGVRVTDNATNEYSTTTMDLGFTPAPTIITPPNLYQFNPSGTAIFDLSSQNSLFLNGQTASTVVEYYATLSDALALTNEIMNQTTYSNSSNPQQVYARLNDLTTACHSIMSFNLVVNTNAFPINNPTPLEVCDDNNDGIALFNLDSKNAEILGSLSNSLYYVTYYESQFAAELGQNGIISSPYFNINPSNQTVWARVEEYANSANFATTSLELIVYAAPTANQPANMVANDNPFDGFASFDLLSQVSSIALVGNTVEFYPSLVNAQNGVNPILNTSSYINVTNPQTIGVRVVNQATGCISFTTFDLIVNNNAFTINNPTPYELCGNTVFTFDLSTKNSEILGALSPSDYSVNYFETVSDAQTGANILPTIYQPIVPNVQTVYVRVTQNATNLFSITTLDLVMNPVPQIPNPIPNLTVYENPFDGVAIFNLEDHTPLLVNGSPNLQVLYFTSQANAVNQTGPIVNSNTYFGTDGQVIWVNIQNSVTGCFTVSSFILRVVDSSLVVFIPDVAFKTLLVNSNTSGGVAANSSFQPILVDVNQDGEIQFSEALLVYSIDVLGQNINTIEGIAAFTNLDWFRCSNNNLTSVDLTANTNLTKLQIGQNQLTTLNVSMLTNLVWLVCDNNLLTSLNVLPLVNLELLDCRFNQLTTIDVSSLSNIYTLDLSHNQLTAINLVGIENVVQLILQNNQLSSIDLSMLTQVEALYLGNNNLSTIDISNLQSVSIIDLSFNNLTTIDASQNTNLAFIGCSNNNLVNLFVKNGSNESNFNNQYVFSNNPSLAFICADEFQIEAIQDSLTLIGNTTCVVNSYCSFTPGGNYNTITGTVKLDGDNNGCDNADNIVPYVGLNVNLNGITTNSSVYTNGVGIYNLYTTIPGIYQLVANLENPTYFNVTSVDIDSNTINNSTIIQNICITPNGSHPDVEVVLAPITPARPGFDATYEIVYKNKGNQTLSGAVTFNYTDTILDFVSSTVAPTTQSTGVIAWNYSNLQPFENRSIGLTLNVNSPVETPAVNINDVFNFTTSISPIVGDEIPSDNTFVFNQTVVGSYDPNDITCLQGAIVSPSEIGNYLHYIINFENTGNFYAENVVVQELIDTSKFDITSLQILNASHAMVPRINGNKVEFVFENINLAEAAGNPPVGGHGNVLFKIKSKDNLVANDFVQKTAKIFFDYNAPIATNIAQTTFQLLNNSVVEFDNSVKIYPNPTSSIITIESEFAIQSYELYDLQGRILEKSFENATSATLDVSVRQNGIYFLKITTERGSKVEKIVKK